MNRRQTLVQEQFLNNEEEVIRRLERTYKQSLDDINKNIEKLMKRFDPETGDLPQSAVYQLKYQKMLKKQVEGILDKMHENEYRTVAEYLDGCYSDGFVGTIFDMHGQDVPLMMPIDQESMVRAVQTDSKISNGLYSRLGEDVSALKNTITNQVSRGISSGMSFAQVAKQIEAKMTGNYDGVNGGAMGRAMTIARTEGHRIQCTAAMDACQQAKERGADVVKQWDSTLDARTRDSHARIDGEIKELDEKFSNGLMFPGDPAGGAAEVVNCRCALLQRARWALEGSFTKMNNFTKEIEEFESPEAYGEFKDAFFSKENRNYMKHVEAMQNKYKTKDFRRVLDAMDDREYKQYSKLLEKNPIYNKKALNFVEKSAEIEVDNPVVPKVINGRNMCGDIDYENSGFDHMIETAMHAQGFDGLPQVVSNEQFEEALKASNFYAERTYCATSQELLDEYREQLYHGKWYVDCSEGGAQYGQGMYCAARFENGKYIIPEDNKIGWEMAHYQELGAFKGNPYYYTEGITLQPDAKIITLYDDTTDIINRYNYEYAVKNAKTEAGKKLAQDIIDIQEQIDISTNRNFVDKVDWDAVDRLYEERQKMFGTDIYQDEVQPLIIKGFELSRGKDPGVLATEMGYDAINAQGHGESGSYTVILNRTKVIFREGGSRYGNN